ncbi:MAG: response regulator [bacterium]|nr:response regulator [bacterium]
MARILILDDTYNIRVGLRALLEQAGYEVQDAANGQEGATLYNQHPPDLIITDVLMPEKGGMEVLLDLRYSFPDVKVIAISGMAADVLPTLKQMGAHRTFVKPFKGKDILQAVAELLAEND